MVIQEKIKHFVLEFLQNKEIHINRSIIYLQLK